MNVSGLAGLFQSSSIFQQNNLVGQKIFQQSIGDTLNRLSKNLIDAQDQAKELKTRFDTLELSAEATNGKKSALEEVPEGLLHFYLNQCKFCAHLSQRHEAFLVEYRDQLSAFDQTIQEYQDMLDGKAALPDQMKLEDVSKLLETTKTAREQFLQQGAEVLNRVSDNSPHVGYMRKAYNMFTEGNENSQNDTHWQINASAKDIYAEIDHALASAHKVTSTFQKGATSILNELKRRGCVQTGEKIYFEDQETAGNGVVERKSLFQSIYNELWNTFKQSIDSETV